MARVAFPASLVLLSAVASVRGVPPPPPHTGNSSSCTDGQDCKGQTIAWIVALAISGVIVIALLIWVAVKKAKQRKALKIADETASIKTAARRSQYSRISTISSANSAFVAPHNPDTPYDPPANPFLAPGYTPPVIEYEYKPPAKTEPTTEAVRFPEAQLAAPPGLPNTTGAAGTTSTAPTYEPPAYIPKPPA